MSAGSPRPDRAIAALAACAALATGLAWGTWVAGGSDSYCYVEQAERWAAGTMLTPQALDIEPPWPDRWLPLAPTGFVPSPTVPGALAPICPAGLSLTMVPFRWIGGRAAVFLVVPVLGALAVWATFLLGAAVAGPTAGALAAWLLAASPIFLFQLVQPMSDVPATAWWTLALWLVVRGGTRGLLWAGVAVAAAVLTRPVLAPLGAMLLAWVLVRPAVPSWRARLRDALWLCGGAAPGAVLLAVIQQALYGAWWRSGYGAPSDLFSIAHVVPNLWRYATWALQAQTPFVAIGVFAFLLAGSRWAASLLAAVIACVAAAYLPYVVFDDWSYLRFLLPALPAALVLASSVAVAVAARLERPWAAVLVWSLALGLTAWHLREARARHVFDLRASEAKFRVTGEYLRTHLPPRAVVLAIWHSGSVRYYGERTSVAWDGFPPSLLDPTLALLEARGHAPYLLLESFEEGRFRERFAGTSTIGALDWPPIAALGPEVRLYRPADRQIYFAGGRVTTEQIRRSRK